MHKKVEDRKLTDKVLFLENSEIQVKEHGEDGEDTYIKIEGYANCTTKDRAGDIILEDAWKGDAMRDFLKNPIVLAHHNRTMPIGKVTDYSVDPHGLKVVAEIYRSAGDIYQQIKDGILRAFSVGFRVLDADYDSETDIFLIKDLSLLEISVVSIPCNQDSLFSLAKSFNDDKDFLDYKKQFSSEESQLGEENNNNTQELTSGDDLMDPKDMKPEDSKTFADLDIDALLEKKFAEKEKAAKAAEEAREKAEQEKAEQEKRVQALVKSGTEDLVKELQEAREKDAGEFAEKIKELQNEIAEKGEEMSRILNAQGSKMNFADRSHEQHAGVSEKEIEDAFLMSKILQRPMAETKSGKALLEKAANASSSTQVSSDTYYETVVSTNIERDLRDLLVVAPLFREISMSAANQIIPINPNATQATWVPVAQVNGGSRDKTTTDDEITKTLTEIALKTYKLAGKAFLTDETEEDAIMPILPLIRESLVEAHQLTLDSTILNGTASTDNPLGLIARAAAASTDVTTTATYTGSVPVTSKMILKARRALGQWGLNLNDLKLVVSLEAYWDLLEDDNFANLNEVGAQATKLTGQVGSLYGLPVMVSTTFPTPAASAPFAVLVNTKNFLMPRQRGFKVQSDYQTEEQRWVLVATQRVGFNHIIEDQGVATLKYAA